MKLRCLRCHHLFSIKGNYAWRFCPECGGDAYWLGSSLHDQWNLARRSHMPTKGSKEWYGDRWFRKDHKTWEADIKSRKLAEDRHTVGRYNDKGERIA